MQHPADAPSAICETPAADAIKILMPGRLASATRGVGHAPRSSVRSSHIKPRVASIPEDEPLHSCSLPVVDGGLAMWFRAAGQGDTAPASRCGVGAAAAEAAVAGAQSETTADGSRCVDEESGGSPGRWLKRLRLPKFTLEYYSEIGIGARC